MKVINLYGGPGTGKSTTAASLFALMKRNGLNVEQVTEFAKDLVWTERNKELGDQIYIFGKMYHKLWRLKDKVDYVIMDSPLPLSIYYDKGRTPGLREFGMRIYNTFDNYNYKLYRYFPYQQEGRYQTEDEANKVDDEIYDFMRDNGISSLSVNMFGVTPKSNEEIIYNHLINNVATTTK